MKKIVSLLLLLSICFSLCACSGGNKKAFEASAAAYDNINAAYLITEQIGSDIYEAWHLGIYDKEKIINEGSSYLANELFLSEEEIKAGVAYTAYSFVDDWDTLSEADKKSIIDSADLFFPIFEDDFFTFCVNSVTNAYILNGTFEQAQTALTAAKGQMKELSEKYSDYEHYPNLKGYYTTTSSFFDFCNEPTGSFEQLKDTINDYENEARDYISDLNYIFEE